MIRVKILKDYRDFKSGQTITLSNNEAFGLINSGIAQITKDMNNRDLKVKGLKRGNTT
jgi:hypothetical protein